MVKIKPVKNFVLVKPRERKMSDIITVIHSEKFNEGEVVEIGPDVVETKPGDSIKYGNGTYIDFDIKTVGGVDYQLISEADIVFVESDNLIPLRDRVIVKVCEQKKTTSGLELVSNNELKFRQAEVLALGPEKNLNQEIKKGDFVLFDKNVGQQIAANRDDLFVINFGDISCASDSQMCFLN